MPEVSHEPRFHLALLATAKSGGRCPRSRQALICGTCSCPAPSKNGGMPIRDIRISCEKRWNSNVFRTFPFAFRGDWSFCWNVAETYPPSSGMRGTSYDTPMERLGRDQASADWRFRPRPPCLFRVEGRPYHSCPKAGTGIGHLANSTPANASGAKRSMECRTGWPRYFDEWPIGKDPADSSFSANMVAPAIRSFFPPRM